MTTAETIAAALPFACLLAALFRAPLAALPIAPPCALILASRFGVVDISSASHPLRVVVPASAATLALLVAYMVKLRRPRTLVASVLIFASTGPDVLALLAWRLPGPWILVPFQIGVCVAILAVLLMPERWFARARLRSR